jgi:hypothetical protein
MFRATASSSPGGLLKSYISYSGTTYSTNNVQDYSPSTLTVSSVVQRGAISESMRMRMEACTTQYIQTPLSSVCDHYDGSKTTITIPVGTTPKPVVVRSVPASETTKRLKEATLFDASNPYDPATRFAVYQEPLPPQPQFLIECPFRPPNPGLVFKPGTNCVINRFEGSKPPTE